MQPAEFVAKWAMVGRGVPAVSPSLGFACVDLDGNGLISLGDVIIINGLLGKTRGQPGYDFRADLDWNGVINSLDYDREVAMWNMACSGEITRYSYDGAGTQIKRAHYTTPRFAPPAAPDLSTVYIGGVYEKTNTGAVTKYYGALGRTIAVRTAPVGAGVIETGVQCQNAIDDDGDTLVNDGCPLYLMADHLGGTTGLLDSAGAVVANSQTKYWPYGNTRSATEVSQTDMRFTGQREEPGVDAALGLYNYKARFYSTVLGRFVSADPVAVDGLNRYAYVRNNPLRWTDPSGLCITIGEVTLPCAEQDAINWLECAFACGGWYGDVARQGLLSGEYWSNVFDLWNQNDETRDVFVANIFVAILTYATPRNLFPTLAGGAPYLAEMFGAGYESSDFFMISLHDILFGTNMVSHLPAKEIIGARPWWRGQWAWIARISGGIPDSIGRNMTDAHTALAFRTVGVAWERTAAGRDPNRARWSAWQRNEVLAGRDELDVDPARLTESAGNTLLGCFADPRCIAAVLYPDWSR